MRNIILIASLACSCSALAVDCTPSLLRTELLQRKATDQAARERLRSSPPPSKADFTHVLAVDAENTKFMRSVVAKCDWPKISIVGEDAAHAAWLLTQHADMDPEYQVLAARSMEVAVHLKEADASRLSLLVDRNRRLNHLPQVYGNQFEKGDDGTVRFFAIVSPHALDARRKEIGLSPFYCVAMKASALNNGAPLEWPTGVLFVPTTCPDDT